MTRAQIDNRNFLSPTGFKFTLKRTPKVAFFCNSANIPELNLGVAVQPSYLKDLDTPGDKIVFGDLNLRFLVDLLGFLIYLMIGLFLLLKGFMLMGIICILNTLLIF